MPEVDGYADLEPIGRGGFSVVFAGTQLGRRTRGCYGAVALPMLSRPGRLGIGYHDQYVAADPPRGSYMVTTIAFDA